MKISKFIEQLQELSDQYNGNIDVVIEYKLKNKVMINNRPKVYAKCIYYNKPKEVPGCHRLVNSGEVKVIISNRVMLYTGKYSKVTFKLGKNKI